jgi:hypothetical protein
VVVLENHSYDQVRGNPDAPFINMLAEEGLTLTQSYAVTHPSQPNYLALFSGSTQHVGDDSCPHTFNTSNLASELLAAGDTFVGYSESLPRAGYSGCSFAEYARKHNPWADFRNLPPSVNQPMTAFPTSLDLLPSVSFVIPNLQHDMHDGTVAGADNWLRSYLSAYASWSYTHNSLLIVTSDEDDETSADHILTILSGADVESGTDSERVDHYTLLRGLEDLFGLPLIGHSANAAPLIGAWQR